MYKPKKKDGITVKDRQYFSELGKKGGERTKARMLAEDPEYYSKIGYKGGMTIVNRHGGEEACKDFYSKISRNYREDQRLEMESEV